MALGLRPLVSGPWASQVQTFLARRKLEQKSGEKQAVERELEERQREVAEARRHASELQQTIEKLRMEAEERELVLAEREQRFVTLRDENLRLEACRHVLTFRLRELENEREPLQLEVVELKEELRASEEEVLSEGKQRKKAEEETREMRARERAMASRLLTAQEQARRAETFLNTTCAELAQMCRHTRERDWDVVTHYIEQRTLLAEQVGHADHRGGPGAGGGSADAEVLGELARQRDRMQGTVHQLRKELQRGEQKQRQERLQSRDQLGLLLADMSELRKANKQLQQQLSHAKQQADAAKARREDETPAQAALRSASRASSRHEAELHALENSVLREQLLFFSKTMPPGKPRRSASAANLSMTQPLPPV